MNERYPKIQHIQYEDEYEDCIEEESICTEENETPVEYPVTQTAARNNSLPPKSNSYRFSPKSNAYKSTSIYHVKRAEKALKVLKAVVKESGWEEVLTHKSGVVVYRKLGINSRDRTPVFMGERIFSGVTPQSVFAVIGMRKLWDDWYEEGSLVENLNDTTSSTYMVMQAFAGSKARDLSLVEKIECTPNGSIFFVATSINNPKVPQMSGRIRAQIKLGGWILEPITFSPPKTKVTYILQVNINGWIPSFFVKKYLTRRPLVLYAIENYLKKNGPPPMVISTTPPPSRGISRSASNISHSDYGSSDVKTSRKKKSFKDLREFSVMMDEEPELSPPCSQQMSVDSSPILSTPEESKPSSVQLKCLSTPQHMVDSPLKQRLSQRTTHRHMELARKALAIVKTLATDYDGWNHYANNQGVRIFMRDVPNKSTPQMRGETVISGGFTPEDILSVIKSFDMRKLWDDRFEEGEIIERLGQNEVLTRVFMRGTFLVGARDFVTVSKIEKDPKTNIIWIADTSVVDPLIPESKKHVRTKLNFSGWRLRPVIDEFDQSHSVEVTYIVDAEMKLESVPPSIFRNILLQIPACVTKVDELVKKTGYPPYVKTSSGIVISEGLNTRSYQYDLIMESVDNGSVTEIKISKMMYPYGFNIFVVPESSRIKLSSDKSVVKITLLIGKKIETLNIRITKNYFNVQYTFNGEKISIAPPKEAEKFKHPAHDNDETSVNETLVARKELERRISGSISSTHPAHDNDESFSTNATLVARNNFDIKGLKEYDQLKHVPRTSIAPDTFKPIEDSSNAIAHEKNSRIMQDIQEIDYSIPKPDQFTKKYIPEPSFTVNATTKYIPKPLVTVNATTKYISEPIFGERTTTSHLPRPTLQRSTSRRISSRMLPEYMMNRTQFHRSSDEPNSSENTSRGIGFFTTGDGIKNRINIILGKNEVSFSPQEAGLMIFFMVLAYYVGKFDACDSVK